MKTDSEKLIEKDAASMPARSTELTNYNSRNEIVDISPTQNNNMVVANQTNTQAVVTFENCNNITLGTVFNVGYSPGNSNLSFQESTGGYAPNMQEDRAYKKTPTIKEMMRCNDPISDAFLEYVSGNFGSKWKDFTIFLGINQLYVERMYEDYYERFGTKEVSLNCANITEAS